VDTAVEAGDRIPPEYDPLICKVIVHGTDRTAALAGLRRALDETEIGGVQTTLPLHRVMLGEPAFLDPAGLSTSWVDTHWDGAASRAAAVRVAAIAAGLADVEGAGPAGHRGPETSPVSPAGGQPVRRESDGSAWRAAGRTRGTNRWPS
jgi:acetyl/propionyl-CoA carboxylase alpha subunit